MAQRTPTKRKSAGSPWQTLLASLYSPRLAGIVLVMVAVLTQLSFMSLTRGRLTDMWIGSLQLLVGVAAWGLPAVIGFLGFWIIVRAMEYQPMPPWHKPAGIVLLYLCLVVGLTLAPARALFRRGSRTTVWWLFCEVVTAIVCHGWSWSEESCLSRF